jgi:hypothetical protein
MNQPIKNLAMRRYLYRFLAAITFYTVFLAAAVWAFPRYHPTGLLAYVLAILPALAIVGVIVVVGLYLAEEKDEFQRTILIHTMLWGMGATMAACTVWGFLELFVGIPSLKLYLIFPMFWAFVGFFTPMIQARYR